MIIDNPKISGSLEVQNHISASDGTITGDLTVQGTVIGTASTASYITAANVDGLTNISSSLASETLKNTTDTLTGDLTVTGNITAQEFHTEFISASIIYESGSTQFGDTLDDTHNFTGSINLTGSLNINGTEVGTGKLDETVFNSYTSSTDTSIQNLTDETSSYALKTQISGSNTSLSSSIASDIEDILDGTSTVTSASYALTASYADSGAGFPFSGSAIITGSLLVSQSNVDFTSATGVSGSFSGSFIGDGSQLSGVTSYTDSDTLSYINSISVVSGSAQVNSGSFSGSFQGDGSGLTGIEIATTNTVTASFNSTGSITISHNFDSKNVSVNVYDENDILILPQQVTLVDNNNVKIDFGGSTSGFAVFAKGGHLVSGSVPVPQISTVTDSFTSVTSHTVTHNFNTKDVIVSVYEGDDLIIPDSITTIDVDNVTVAFPEAVTGRVVVVKSGHIVSGSIPFENITNKPTLLSGSAQIATDISGSFTSLSSSLESRVSDQETFSSSLDATFATDADLNLVSSSVDSINAATSSYALENSISGSFTSTSSSLASELLKNTTDTLTGDLTVTGTLTAQEFHTEFVSASILFDSGSTKFGDTSDDSHDFTGSLNTSGNATFGGDVTLSNGNSLRWTSDDVRIEGTTASDNMKFYVGATEILKLEQSGLAATFAGDVSVTGGDLTLGTDSIASNINGVGDVLSINVDSNTGGGAGANIQLKTAGTTQLTINNSSSTFAGSVRAEDRFDLYNGTKILQLKNVNNVFSIRNGNTGLVPLTIDASGESTFAGRVNAGESFGALKDGANTVADGPFFRLTNAATTRQYLFQLDASNNIDYWYYNGSTWTQTISLLTNGGITLSGDISASTGDLALLSSSGEYILYGATDGQTNLYHNGLKKFETTSTGIEVNGGADTQAVITGTTTAARLDIKTNSHHRFLQTIESDGKFRLFNQTTNSEQFSIASNHDATFSGNVGVAGKTPAYGLNLAQGTGAGNKIAWTDGTPDFAASIYANSSTDKLTFATKNASNVETTALEIDTSQNSIFAGTGTFEGGGNTLTLKKGTGTAALAFAGASSTPEASALIEGVAGGGLKIYTSTSSAGTIADPGWSSKLTIAQNGNAAFEGTITAPSIGIPGANASYAFYNNSNSYFNGNVTIDATLLVSGLSNYTGLEVKGSGASRPQIKFSNVNQGILAQIYGTESNSLVTTAPAGLEYQVRNLNGSSGNHVFKSYNTAILTLDGGSNNATFAGEVSLKSRLNLQRSSAGATTLIQFKNENSVDRAHIDFGGTNEELSFFAGDGSSEHMRIKSDGKIGLGKSSPYYDVDATEIGANSHAWGSSGATFGQDHYQIRELNNLLWNAYDRFKDYGSSSNLTSAMFDGNFDSGTALPTNSTHVIEIDFGAQGSMTYPYGFTVISFYYVYNNFTSVSGEQYHAQGTYAGQWRAMGTPVDIRGSAGSGVRVVKIPGGNNNYVTKFRYTFVTGNSSTNVTDISYMTSRPAGYPISAYMRGDRHNNWFKNIYFKNSSHTTVGSIVPGNSSTAYNTSSDYRLKENIVSITDALDRVSQLKPSRFNFISDADKTLDGFLAHEVQEIVPEAITGEKDAVDEQGNPKLQAIDQSKLVPLLVAAIQELKAEIEILKNT